MSGRIYAKNPGHDDDWILEGELSDADLVGIAQCKKVRCLTFQQVTSLPPRPFHNLPTLRLLRHIVITACPIARGDFADLAAIAKLESLLCTDCPIVDEDVAYFREHPKLNRMFLNGSQITDAALAHLVTIPGLAWLELDDTAITDAGLRQLSGAVRLNHLALRNTAVTDDGILQLACLPKLDLAAGYVKGTAVTEEGLDVLFAEQKSLAREAKSTGKEKAPASIPVDELEAAKKVLYGFFKAMSECEREFAERLEKNREAGGETDLQATLAQFEACREAYRRIFAIYCTAKKRAYGRPDNVSIGGPQDYESDPTLEPITSVSTPTTRRIVIETKQKFVLNYRCQYVLVKERERWLIDSKKIWGNGWEQTIL